MAYRLKFVMKNLFIHLQHTKELLVMKYAIATVKVTVSLLALGALIWQGFVELRNVYPRSVETGSTAGVLDISILVFREGLECILVLAAVTAGMSRSKQGNGKAISAGAGFGLLAILFTWFGAIHVIDNLGNRMSALQLQASTGLLAILILLIVMNWFFHKLYWTGWISMHNKRKNSLIQQWGTETSSKSKFFWGMALLGFSSLYREGVEVVLFLQSYRLRFGGPVLLRGVAIGLTMTAAVGV